MRYEVRSVDDKRRLQIDAVDWMMAMSGAIEEWKVQVTGWTCSTRANGEVHIQDSSSGRRWVVSPIRTETARRPLRKKAAGPGGAPPPPSVGRSLGAPPPPNVRSVKPRGVPEAAPPQAPAGATPPAAPETSKPVFDGPPPVQRSAPRPRERKVVEVERAAPTPKVAMPEEPAFVPDYGPEAERAPDIDLFDPNASVDAPEDVAPTIAKELPEELRMAVPGPENLAERLFEMADEIADCPSAYEASELVLELCMEEIGCEAGSVLRGSINDQALTFVTCAGPAGDALVGRKLRFGRGLVGFSFDQGFTIVVNDVHDDERHLSQVDDETGFQTLNVLCTPVRTEDEHFGVVQLLNVEGGFAPWHVEVAESLSKSLAAALAAGLH